MTLPRSMFWLGMEGIAMSRGGCIGSGIGPPRPPPRGGFCPLGGLRASSSMGRSGAARPPGSDGFSVRIATPAIAFRASMGRIFGLLLRAISANRGLSSTVGNARGTTLAACQRATIAASPFSLVSSSSGAIFTESMCVAVSVACFTIVSGRCSSDGRMLRSASTPPHASPQANRANRAATTFSP